MHRVQSPVKRASEQGACLEDLAVELHWFSVAVIGIDRGEYPRTAIEPAALHEQHREWGEPQQLPVGEVQERCGNMTAGMPLGNDQIRIHAGRRAHYGFIGRIVPLGRDVYPDAESPEPSRLALESRETGLLLAALDVRETADPGELIFERQRRVDRLKQHELGSERTGELRRLAEGRRSVTRPVLDGNQDASDAAHDVAGR